MSQAGVIHSGGSGTGDVVTLTGNSGGAVSPDVFGNINVIGAGGVLVTGNPGTNTLTITGATGSLSTATVTLTALQVKALNGTPITLIAAQGPGTIIVCLACSVKLTYGGTSPFTDGGGSQMTLSYVADSTQVFTVTFSCVVQTATFLNLYNLVSGMNETPYASAQNQPVIIWNQGSNFTGNAANDNTVTINVQYIVITL